MRDDQIVLITEDGKEELATILFTHHDEENNYVVFEFVETGEISAAKYIEGADGEGEIIDIETDEEWEMLDDLLQEYFDELELEVEDEEDFE